MTTTMRCVALSVLAIALVASPALALKPGDAAPPLSEVDWLRGEPIPQWEPGHVYVLDFWATWCGPCIANMPKLVSLAKKYEDQNVHVIGVAVWPRRGQTPTRSFVARKSEWDFHFAEDRRSGATAQTFLTASGINSIPHAIVIDKTGKIAWINHPGMGLEQVVEALVNDSFDPEALAREEERRLQQQAQVRELTQQLREANENGDVAGQLEPALALVEIDPVTFAQMGVYRYYLLLAELARDSEAEAYAEALMNETFSDVPRGLDNLAYVIATSEQIPDAKRDLDLALRAATRSNEMGDWKDATSLEAIASVHFARGEVEEAIGRMEQAIEQSMAGRIRDRYEQTLAQYQAALTTSAGDPGSTESP